MTTRFLLYSVKSNHTDCKLKRNGPFVWFFVGLEDIGKQLVGEEKWQSLYPAWRDVEQERTPDFDPSEVPEADIQDIASAVRDEFHNF